MTSFSKKIKQEILVEQKLKTCCAFSLIYGFCFLAKDNGTGFLILKTNAENGVLLDNVISGALKNKRLNFDICGRNIRLNKEVSRYFTIAEYKEHVFKCKNCAGNFLKSVFLICGTISNPEKSYRLDLIFDEEEKQLGIFELLVDLGFSPKKSLRRGKHLLYFKDSEQISDFLAFIGANNATFEIINSKILKELRNNANRAANCDTANINKSINASKKYVTAITDMQQNGEIDLLPIQLKETAFLRIEFQELNFEQLGKKFDPPISKSGVYHRLEKILEIYEKRKVNK